jgi:hypothetical protein
MSDDERGWFEEAWTLREETLYRQLFGDSGDGIHVLSFEKFSHTFGQKEVDPRWLTHGVLVFPPDAGSPHWRYVTSGLSNAWEDDTPEPNGPSGLGVEYVMTTPAREDWALNVTLNMLAYQLLLAAGAYGDPSLIGLHHRVPLNGPLDGKDSVLTHILFGPADDLGEQQLPSGIFRFLHLVGISAAEKEHGRENGGEALLQLLQRQAAYPLTDAMRGSLL